jgi:hypothetical protein
MKSWYHRITGPLGRFVSANHGYVAAAMLISMFVLGYTSMIGNSAIVDEVAHISAGYSYLHFGDYRLNPEHPPLMKDLAALPLQFMNLKFPNNTADWTTEVNGEWDTGWDFLYNMGNNADAILFWARLPILIFGTLFGVLLYVYSRRRWGIQVALLALFFYALSPNIIGHSILVTTDIGASVFIFIALITFGRFASKPTGQNMLLLSFALAGAQLAKFSAILLYPLLAGVTLVMVWLYKHPGSAGQRFRTYAGGLVAASGLSALWIYLFYWPHVWNMSTAVQDRLIVGSLVAANSTVYSNILVWISHVPLMKPAAQYILGVVMVSGRVAGGNVTYFNGMVTDQSFKWYFPETVLLKTQVSLLIMAIVVAGVMLWRYFHHRPFKAFDQFRTSFQKHTLEWTLGAFAGFYFVVSILGNLNLGIRHILPIYIPIFVLTAIGTIHLMRRLAASKWQAVAGIVFAALLFWYGASTIAAAPNFLSYFNELIGGGANAENYFTDSSVDWGQDLLRLRDYINNNPQINHIAVDYFGGGLVQYYFCDRAYDGLGHLIENSSGYDCTHSKVEIWHSSYGRYTGQYIAVSETYLENDRYFSAISGQEGYGYLRAMKPIAKIGNSIYVYKLY